MGERRVWNPYISCKVRLGFDVKKLHTNEWKFESIYRVTRLTASGYISWRRKIAMFRVLGLPSHVWLRQLIISYGSSPFTITRGGLQTLTPGVVRCYSLDSSLERLVQTCICLLYHQFTASRCDFWRRHVQLPTWILDFVVFFTFYSKNVQNALFFRILVQST